MLLIRLDATNPATVDLPEDSYELLQLANRYIAYESAQMPANQIPGPPLSVVEEATEDLRRWVNQAEDQEQARSVASSHYKEIRAEAISELERAIATLKLHFLHRLDQAEPWGVQATHSKRGWSIRKPSKHAEWYQFLQDYLEQEGSLLASEQLDHELYTRLQEIAGKLDTYRTARDTARAQRQIAIQNRNEAKVRLSLLLQGAVFMICMLKLEGRIRQELEQWGFRVITPQD